MAAHHRCEWNCGGTDCDAPKHPPREDGPAINLGFYAGTYGGTRPADPQPRTDHLTGCQYLEAVSGGLTPRLDKAGAHIGCR